MSNDSPDSSLPTEYQSNWCEMETEEVHRTQPIMRCQNTSNLLPSFPLDNMQSPEFVTLGAHKITVGLIAWSHLANSHTSCIHELHSTLKAGKRTTKIVMFPLITNKPYQIYTKAPQIWLSSLRAHTCELINSQIHVHTARLTISLTRA